MRRIKTGRSGPVLLQVPLSTLAAVEEVELLQPREYEPSAGDPNRIRQAAQLLLDSSAPLILAGGGVHSANAADELLAVAEHLQAPVVTSTTGKGAISDDHPLALGYAELAYPRCASFCGSGTWCRRWEPGPDSGTDQAANGSCESTLMAGELQILIRNTSASPVMPGLCWLICSRLLEARLPARIRFPRR